MKAEIPPPETLVDLLPSRRGSSAVTAGSKTTRLQDFELDSVAERRFQRLRAQRSRLANQRGLPAYVICHDSTLKLIAVHAPRSIAEMESIKGMGPMKVKLYGESFLAALNSANATD
jgi:ATP-dependent DNA helicase RecQ